MRPELEPLVGCFVNTLALRDDLSGDPTFVDLVARVRETTLGAYANQDVPFERLVAELQVPRDLAQNPLFTVMLVQHSPPTIAVDAADLRAEWIRTSTDTAKFDLTLFLDDSGEEIFGRIEYRISLFDAAFIGGLRAPLRAAAALGGRRAAPRDQQPGDAQPVGAPGICWWELNDSTTEYPKGKCVHQLFEEQALRTPHAIAVRVAELSLSYARLDAQGNRLAAYLRSLGVGPDVRVGVCLEPSLELVIAIVGILKAGGAYVPLEPSHPPARLELMLRDAAARIVVTRRSVREQLRRAVCGSRARGVARPTAAERAVGSAGIQRGNARQPRLRHLHLGLDGRAQGRGGAAPRPGQLPELLHRRVRP